MSKPDVDSDGFQIVSSKRFSKRKQTKIPRRDFKIEEPNIPIDIKKSKQRIYSAVQDLQGSSYLDNLTESVSTSIQSRPLVEIVCFGLGHVGECNISRYQLGLLLCLKNSLKPRKVFVHDPVFYKTECSILKYFELEIIEQNQEGGYIIPDEGITLLYFPHCPKQLTNNFLWSNWGLKLQNCILICNSFTSLFENQPHRIISETVPFIHKIFPHTTEVSVENNFKFTDIFNDTSIHIFPKEKLDKLDSDFWITGNKPEYKDTEEFITALMIEKLTL